MRESNFCIYCKEIAVGYKLIKILNMIYRMSIYINPSDKFCFSEIKAENITIYINEVSNFIFSNLIKVLIQNIKIVFERAA